jgi:hypothetical protein
MPKRERLIWTDRVQRQLLEILPLNAEVILLAGLRYRQEIQPFLKARGFSVVAPMQGMRIGQQLKYLKRSADASCGVARHHGA